MSVDAPVIATERLNKIWKRGKDFLGSELPIMCGAMTWISDPDLVSRMSNLGAFGVLAAGNMPQNFFRSISRKPANLRTSHLPAM